MRDKTVKNLSWLAYLGIGIVLSIMIIASILRDLLIVNIMILPLLLFMGWAIYNTELVIR